MSKDDLQLYLEKATQLILIEEEHPTEQTNVNNTTNFQFEHESLDELLTIGGSH